MIEVELPDGTIAEFPDGTSQDVMKSALQKRFGGAQQPSGASKVGAASGAWDDRPQPDTAVGRGMRENFAPQRQQAERPSGQGFGNNVAQAAGDGLFMGFGDEISARLNAMTGYDASTGSYGNWGTTYDDQLAAVRGQEKQFRDDHPVVSTAAEIGGALLPAVAGAGAVAQGGNLLSQIGRGALYGGATGAAYGFGEGEGGVNNRGWNALANGALGVGVGGATALAGAGIRSAMQGRAQRRAIAGAARGAPSTEELRAAGNALYQQVDDAGVQISPEAFDRTRAGILDRLRNTTGYDELPGPGSLTPNTARVMSIMDEASGRMAAEPTAALPFRSLDQMRRQAGAAAGNVTNKTDQRAGMAVIEGLDDFVQKLGPEDVIAGDPDALKSAISKARDVWSRMSKSQLVDDAMERSENYLSGSASGVRNQFKNILQNKKLAAQFTAAEKAALRSVTHGSTLDQLINLAGGGLAQMGSIGGGFAAGGPLGALAGAGLAAGQRKLAEGVTMRSAERARAAIASGALRNPEVMNALAIAGQVPQRLTNALGLAAIPGLGGWLTTP